MEIIKKLIKEDIKISSAESFTGGLFANTLTNVEDISKIYKGSVIVYDAESKIKKLGVRKETITKNGTISKETAIEMATQCMTQFDTDIGVSFTGNAGPSSIEGKSVGLGYIGIIFKDQVNIKKFNLKGDREAVKQQSVDLALKLIEEMI